MDRDDDPPKEERLPPLALLPEGLRYASAEERPANTLGLSGEEDVATL